MKLLFVHSHRFVRCENLVYTKGQLPYTLFKERYMNNFNHITICSRMTNSSNVNNLNLSSGSGVEFLELPNLSNVKKRFYNIRKAKKILMNAISNVDVVVARMPSKHAVLAIDICEKLDKPYVVEVVGDVYQALWNHGSIKGKVIAPMKYLEYRRIISKSKYTIYVTEEYLQRRYPSAKGAYTINASNVEIEIPSKFVLQKRLLKEEERKKNKLIIGLIGSYATKYKGIDNAIDLIAALREKGIDATLRILGDGDNSTLIKRAKSHGIDKYIHFDGLLPAGTQVLEWLDKLDLYIQPSLTEGLPRSVIEAMSRALPVVASNVGGIPELINSEFLHKAGDSSSLCDKVLYLLESEMENEIKRNFIISQSYTKDVLVKRRNDFWNEFIKKEFN